MKPRFIFSAVAAVCILMVMTLPRLAHGTVAVQAAAYGPLPIVPIETAAPSGENAAAAPVAVTAAQAPLSEAPVSEEPVSEAPVSEPPLSEAPLSEAPLPVIEGEPVAAADIPAAQPPPAQALAQDEIPALEVFAAALVNGQAGQVVGLYMPGLAALPVRQQPGGASDYISDENGTVTQYDRPNQYGVVGLLAHNTLSGREFFYLGQNQDVFLVYGDGSSARFRVRQIQQYQALSPYDTRSDFVDLSSPGGAVLSHSEVYRRVYTNDGTLVLQTCIEANGEPTWGRLFVIAEPL